MTWLSTASCRRTSTKQAPVRSVAPRTALNVYPSDAMRYVSFNLALAPFDDIHVRKAVNLGLRQGRVPSAPRRPDSRGELAGHIFVNKPAERHPEGLRPVPDAEPAGDIEDCQGRDGAIRSTTPMATASVMRRILQGSCSSRTRPSRTRKQAALVAGVSRAAGYDARRLEFRALAPCTTSTSTREPVAFCGGSGLGQGLRGRLHVRVPLFGSAVTRAAATTICSGATADLLKGGYDVTEVPCIDDKVESAPAAAMTLASSAGPTWTRRSWKMSCRSSPSLFDNNVDIMSATVDELLVRPVRGTRGVRSVGRLGFRQLGLPTIAAVANRDDEEGAARRPLLHPTDEGGEARWAGT